MAEIEQILRVQMDEESLHRLLDPILQEVNNLRARVAKIEAWQLATQDFCEATHDSLVRLENLIESTIDDGK